MKSFLECVSCILKQADEIGSRLFANDPVIKKSVHDKAVSILKGINITSMTPPDATTLVHNALSKLTGIDDFYEEIKKENNSFVLELYPKLEEVMDQSADKLLTAIRLSIAGNLIDYGAHSSFDVNTSLDEALSHDLMINDYEKLKGELKTAKQIMYVGDNAGEIVFDKLLVAEFIKMGKKVAFAVKSKPILNDVMIKDAKDVSMTKLTKVIKSGSDIAGTDLSKTSDEFNKEYNSADLVIAKGQGNLETLEDKSKSIYYLLKCKCEHLARRLRCSKGGIILLSNTNPQFKSFLKGDLC